MPVEPGVPFLTAVKNHGNLLLLPGKTRRRLLLAPVRWTRPARPGLLKPRPPPPRGTSACVSSSRPLPTLRPSSPTRRSSKSSAPEGWTRSEAGDRRHPAKSRTDSARRSPSSWMPSAAISPRRPKPMPNPHFENLGADCITLSPYLGKDSIEPFIQNPEKGVFLLCKTSNPGAGDLQDLLVLDRRRWIARTKHAASSLFHALHVAQTGPGMEHQEQHRPGRRRDPSRDAQRASAQPRPTCGSSPPASAHRAATWNRRCEAGLRKDGKGLLINVSRGISRRADPRQGSGGAAGCDARNSEAGARESWIARRNEVRCLTNSGY